MNFDIDGSRLGGNDVRQVAAPDGGRGHPPADKVLHTRGGIFGPHGAN